MRVKKIYIYHPIGGTAPLLDFMEALDDKAKKKLVYVLKSIALSPVLLPEPHVKHFSIERYRQLYELRERLRILIRIIFTLDKDGNIILLEPFIKRHKRNTNQALENSLNMLADIRRNPGALQQYDFHKKAKFE